MPLTLAILNAESLPDGGPTSITVRGERGIDIGRDQYLDWTLPDPDRIVSTRHCEVRWRDGAYWLTDISTNGTFVNGSPHRVAGPHRLANGDRLEIGHYVIGVTLDEKPAGPAPEPVQAPAPGSGGDFWGGGDAAPPVPAAQLRPPPPGPPPGDMLDWFVDVPPPEPRAEPGAEPLWADVPLPRAADPFASPGIAQPPAAAPPPFPPAPAEVPAAPAPVPAMPPAAPPAAPAFELEPIPPLPPAFPPVGDPVPQAPPMPPMPVPAQPPPPMPAQVMPAQTMPGYGMPAAAPPQPAAYAPLPDAAPAPAPQNGGAALAPSELAALVARGAGVAPDVFANRPPQELAMLLGLLMRISADNLQQLLKARADTKGLVRSTNQTMIQAFENNPLKFSPTVEDAIRIMFDPHSRSYLDARRTLEQSFSDLKQHQINTYGAMQQALKMVVEDLDPEAVDASTEKESGLGAMMGSRKAKLWETYVTRWKAKTAHHDNGLLDTFMLYFSECYDRLSSRLRT